MNWLALTGPWGGIARAEEPSADTNADVSAAASPSAGSDSSAAASAAAAPSATPSAGSDSSAAPSAASDPFAAPSAAADAWSPGADASAVAAPDPFAAAGAGGLADEGALLIKLYGDTQLQARNDQPVKDSFAAAHLDLFATADVGRLSFLSEVFFEADSNEMEFDLERMQVSYLVSNALRLRAGRSHTAFGYYNDTYHHGNLFELTTGRPYAVQFEDVGGLFCAHLVGLGADGSFGLAHGALRYDLEVGNGRLSDLTQVAIFAAGKSGKMANLRLRYIHDSGFTLGANGVVDSFPAHPADADAAFVPKTREYIAGTHVTYMERGFHVLYEGSATFHAPTRSTTTTTTTYAAFLELGYDIGAFTPYARAEIIRFPTRGDVIYQGPFSTYRGVERVLDGRVGLRYRPMPQLALRAEADVPSFDGRRVFIATTKLAFGF